MAQLLQVLWAEDDEDIIDAHRDVLGENDFEVIPARSSEDAMTQARELCPPIAIVDLSLPAALGHPTNIDSGFELLDELHEWDQLIETVVVSGNLRPDNRKRIEDLQRERGRSWATLDKPIDRADLLDRLRDARKRIDDRAGRSAEFRELDEHQRRVVQALCNGRRRSISIGRSLRPGHSGARVYEVRFACDDATETFPFILKLVRADPDTPGADPQKLVKEYANYEQHVKDRLTINAELVASGPCSGILYWRVGTHSDSKIVALKEQLTDDARHIAGIGDTISRLFTQRMRPWSTNQTEQKSSIAEEYEQFVQMDRVRKQASVMFGSAPSAPRIPVPGVDHELPNPMLFAESLVAWPDRLPMQCRTVHGDLHCENVWIDEEGQEWLIDFGQTGRGHAAKDYAQLEASIKFDAISRSVLLGNLVELETGLIAGGVAIQDAHTLTSHPLLQRCARAIGTVRHEAHQSLLKGDAPETEYCLSLFFCALRQVMYPDMNQPYAFVSAALLAEKLAPLLEAKGWKAPT